MFPLASIDVLGKVGVYVVEIFIGFLFGYALEISGFNNAYLLTGQFYFRNGRVIKTLFTAIIVGMVLIFGAVALGILDYDLIWVDPTHLWPGVLGAAIMGVGFVIGGYCPGTSVVSSVTLKKDGMFYVLGGLVGAFLFSETEPLFHYFYNNSTNYGRVTLMDVFHTNAGVVVVVIVIMALLLFWLNEALVKRFGREDSAPHPLPKQWPIGAVAILVLAFGVWAIQPSLAQMWTRVAPEQAPLLEQYQVQIHPGELVKTMNDHTINTVIIDVRDDYSYNLFHLKWARHIPLNQFPEALPALKKEAKDVPLTVFVLVSDDEGEATDAWKMMAATKIPNIYILSGGMNEWITIFGEEDMAEGLIFEGATSLDNVEALNFYFVGALGDRYRASDLNSDEFTEEWLETLKFTPKIKLQRQQGPVGGGCG